jgi:hypothetical protein
MQAHPRLASPAPEPSSSAATPKAASPSIPATCEHEHSSPEPYWWRLARALILLFLAVSLHVWGMRSREPQEPVYATLASRLFASMLVSPPLPLAPALRPITKQRWGAGRSVTIQTTVLKVPTVPGPPVSSPATVDPVLVAVGTSSTTIGRATDTPDVAPRLAPAAPTARATVDDTPPIAASTEPRPAPITAASATIPLREPRIQSTAPSLDRLALSANRVALPADRKEADPENPADAQSRQKEGVLAVVREYTRALEQLDVRATKAVYPSVDDRRLRRSFADVETQRFQLGSCGVSLSSSGNDANALCLGNSTYRPKVGSRVLRYTNQVWEFNLARDGGGWQILEARIQ